MTHVTQSAISDSVSLPGKLPAGMVASQLPMSQAKDLEKGLGWSSWELSTAVFHEQGPSWLPVMHFVLTSRRRMLPAEFSLNPADPGRTVLFHPC